jgi:ribosomal protein S18 acetylase RimI-like enzyme
LYDRLSEPQRSEQVARVLEAAMEGRLRLEGLIACRDADKVVGAMLCVAAAGRTMMVWPPALTSDLPVASRPQVIAQLVDRMRALARESRARIVQALLAPGDEAAALMLAHGFHRVARLTYLQRSVVGLELPPPSSAIEYVTFSDDTREDFVRALAASYVGSMDCPEIDGARDPAEVLESHRNQGEFRPEWWFLAKIAGQAAGCLLLVGLPEYRALEIAYVAVLPPFRGRGLGRELTRKALREASAAGVEFVTLAVDSRNRPALDMYAAEGFSAWDERDACLLMIDPLDGRLDRRLPRR